MRIRLYLFALWTCVLLAAAPPTAAAEPDAQQLFDSAQQHFDSQRFAAALPLFRQAYEVSASPNARLYVARCLRELGKVAEAYDEMHATAREATAKAEAEERYVPTRDAAAAELAVLELKVGKLVISLRGAVEGATVSLDGAEVPAGRLGVPITMAPGKHAIQIRAPGRPDVQQQVEVAAGRTQSVAVAPGELTKTGAPKPVGLAVPEDSGESSGGGVRIAGIAITTMGVAGMVVFAITHLMADDKLATLEEECGDARCTDPKYADTVDSGKTLETVANVSVIAGSALIVSGVAMIIFGGPSEAEAPVSALLSVSPAGTLLGVQGRF